MKKKDFKNLPEVEDITPKLSPKKRLGIFVLGLFVTVVVSAAGWWVYKNVYEMRLLRKALKEAVVLISPDLTAKEFSRISQLNEAQLAHYISQNILSVESSANSSKKTELAKNALELGKRLNYSRILTVEAQLMEDGLLTGYDEDEVRAVFKKAFEKIKERSKSGDAQEVLAYAELLNAGKKYLPESTASTSKMVLNVLGGLTNYELDTVSQNIFTDISEMKGLAKEMIRRGLKFNDGYFESDVYRLCRKLNPLPLNLEINTNQDVRRYIEESNRMNWVIAGCKVEILAPYIEISPGEILDYYENEKETHTHLKKLIDSKFYKDDQNKSWFEKDQFADSGSNNKNSKPDYFAGEEALGAKSGYVKGEPIRHNNGLSLFEVDNTGTNRDAIVRIYYDGKKPASRSMLVKAGEKFTAKNLSPGNYKMRYRFSDSKKVFEANNVFAVTEEKTESGTRFSRITVTLYKTKDGNMQTAEVSEEDF